MKMNSMLSALLLSLLLMLSVLSVVPLGATTDDVNAKKTAEDVIGKYFVKCGDNWYCLSKRLGLRQVRNLRQFAQNGSLNLTTQVLSAADKLNGYEYKGEFLLETKGPSRAFIIGGDKWTEWEDTSYDIRFFITKKNGEWSTKQTYGKYEPRPAFQEAEEGYYLEISCESIGKYLGTKHDSSPIAPRDIQEQPVSPSNNERVPPNNSGIEATEANVNALLQQALANISERKYATPSPKSPYFKEKTLKCLAEAIKELGTANELAAKMNMSDLAQKALSWKNDIQYAREILDTGTRMIELGKSYSRQIKVKKEIKTYLEGNPSY